jgi:formylglycine-generating enzyme required for sulfatase activity
VPPAGPSAEAPAGPEPGTTAEAPGTQPPVVRADPKVVLPAGFLTAADNTAAFGEPGYTIVHEPTGMEFVWVPAGEFEMGAYGGNPDATPARKVTIGRGMWFGKHEVTNAQFRQFCVATRSAFPAASDAGPRHPVVMVSWEEARKFAEHNGMRLPTEAEWEYAARGPSGGSLPWGERWNESLACAADNRGPDGRSYPVGSFPEGASWCGALDMAGNVFEWCADWYHHRTYSGGDDTDPQGPATGTYRVVRGGSFANPAPLCRTYIRSKYPPNYVMRHLGFRCVLAQPAQAPARGGPGRSPRTGP